MKIAVIGTGIIGRRHLDAVQQSKHWDLCAICDINEAVASNYAKEYGVPCYTDYRDIPAKTDADAVILNLPHWLHCEVAEFFLEHGMHVLVEKPMANTTAECERMIAAANRSGKKLAVGHLQRFFQANRKVKDICLSGALGTLCMITEYRTIDYFSPDRPKWFLDRKLSGGGIVMNYGAHALDKMFYILDSRPQRICATTANIKNDCTIEGHAQAYIDFDNHVSANITFSGYGNAGYETVYYFSNGALKVIGGTKLFEKVPNEGWREIPISDDNAIYYQLEEFYKFVNGQENDMPTGEYGKEIIASIEQIYADR